METKLNTQNINQEGVSSNGKQYEEKKKLILHWAGFSFDVANRDWYKYSCRVGKLVIGGFRRAHPACASLRDPILSF